MTEESERKEHDFVLEAIDQLRHRKARPDRDRISHMVARKHGLSFEAVHEVLQRMVDLNIVIKVDYKGSTSYRNAAKWKRNPYAMDVSNPDETSHKLYTAVRALWSQASAVASSDAAAAADTSSAGCPAPLDLSMHRSAPKPPGATFKTVEAWLLDADCTTTLVGPELEVAIQKELESGRIRRLKDGGLCPNDPWRVAKPRRPRPLEPRPSAAAAAKDQAYKYLPMGKRKVSPPR